MDCADISVDCQEPLERIRRERIEIVQKISILKAELLDVTKQLEEAGVSPDCKISDIRRSLGCKKFNLNPKTGLEFLFENGVLCRSPIAVARFFVDEKHTLSKSSIGIFLGEISKDFNMQVLDEFLRLHEFQGQEFLPSLRKFLLSFQLPGESQKIDRILISFGQQYVSQNPTVFKTAHEAYVLAYATILLNTTLHNSNAKNHNLGLADEKIFVRTMLEFDEDTNLSEEIIKNVYHGIKSRQLQVVEETSETIIMSGWLLKLGGRVKSWKRRWFVLTDDKLLYYNTQERTRRKGAIQLDHISVRRTNDRSHEYCFELFSRRDNCIGARKADRENVVVTDNHITYRLAAQNIEDHERWFTSLHLITERFGSRRGASVPCFSNRSINSDVKNLEKEKLIKPPTPSYLPNSPLIGINFNIRQDSSKSLTMEPGSESFQ